MQNDPSRSIMSGAPRPIAFKSGLTLNMSPINDRMFSELDHYVQGRYMETALASMPQSEKATLYPQCAAFAARMSWCSEDGARIIATVDGLAMFLFVTCRGNHPDLTLDKCKAAFVTATGDVDIDDKEKIDATFGQLNPLPKSLAKKAQPTKRKKVRRK